MAAYIGYDLREKNRIQENTLAFNEEQLGFLAGFACRKNERETSRIPIVENKLLTSLLIFSKYSGKDDITLE